MNRETIVILLGAFIAVIAQIVIAPNIALFSAMPNFLLVYSLIVAVLRPHMISTVVLGFVFGLLYDLLGHGAVGVMAFLTVFSVYVTSRLFVIFNNDTFFMPLLMIGAAVFAVEFCYAIFMLVFGVAATPLEAFIYRAIPCALYDCLLAIVLYPLVSRCISGGSRSVTRQTKPSSHGTSVQVSTQGGHRIRKSKKKMPRF